MSFREPEWKVFTDDGELFIECPSCRKTGRVGWAHACGANWYADVAELRRRETESRAEVLAENPPEGDSE